MSDREAMSDEQIAYLCAPPDYAGLYLKKSDELISLRQRLAAVEAGWRERAKQYRYDPTKLDNFEFFGFCNGLRTAADQLKAALENRE